MQWISCHDGELQTLVEGQLRRGTGKSFWTGLKALDALVPDHGLARGAVHEVLGGSDGGMPLFFTLLLAKAASAAASGEGTTPAVVDAVPAVDELPVAASSLSPLNATMTKAIVWCDPQRQLYPPALAAAGVPLDRVILLHPTTVADEIWAVAECLRCTGVSATIAAPARLSRIEARRLQLAAEQGAGVGLLIRPWAHRSAPYAAATRWLVQPAPGERTVQRWTIQLIHGHGGRVGQTVILEYSRETHRVRASEQLVDRQAPKKTTNGVRLATA